MENEQTIKQKMVTFATSDHYLGAIELMKAQRTQMMTVLDENEFKTLVNALTLELEANLIQRFVVAVDNIRTGKNLDE